LKRTRSPEPLEEQRERVRRYRNHCREDGYARIDMWLPPEVEQSFQRLMQVRKLGRKDLIVALIGEAIRRLDSDGEP
jgi:hypothetical protein